MTMSELIEETARLVHSNEPVCVYVTEALFADMKRKFKGAPALEPPIMLPPTMFGTPVIVNDEMATVGGKSWEFGYRYRPTTYWTTG